LSDTLRRFQRETGKLETERGDREKKNVRRGEGYDLKLAMYARTVRLETNQRERERERGKI